MAAKRPERASRHSSLGGLSTRPIKCLWYTLGAWGGIPYKPKWRNRQTRTTQNRVPSGNEGSIPSFGTRGAPAPLGLYPPGYSSRNVLGTKGVLFYMTCIRARCSSYTGMYNKIGADPATIAGQTRMYQHLAYVRNRKRVFASLEER